MCSGRARVLCHQKFYIEVSERGINRTQCRPETCTAIERLGIVCPLIYLLLKFGAVNKNDLKSYQFPKYSLRSIKIHERARYVFLAKII